jgi:hypothetical protein
VWAELCRDGRKRQRIGDRVDGREAGLADRSTISRSSVKARKAGARDVGDCMAHSPRRGDGEGQGGLFSGVLGLGMMEWQL